MEEDRRLEFNFTAQDVIDQGRTKREYIDEIKEWLPNSGDKLVPPALEEQMVILFLLSCKNDVEFTKKTILAFYRCKKNAPEIHDNRDLKRLDVKLALNTIHMSSIPERTDDNCSIHYFKLHDTSYHNFDLYAIMKISYMLVDVTLKNNPPDGLIVIIDMKGMGLMHMTKLKVGAIKKYFQFLQEGFPMKLRVIYVINAVYFMDKIMSIIRVFMKSELVDMLKIYPADMPNEKLHELVPKKCWPRDYGGDLPSERDLHDFTMDQLKDRQKFWEIEESIRKECQK
ncbi:unnamed protein product [Acanthoscelides obtectus]|uniref:CRAL-TRIO domain-containing protein n=1 Tax=Acanthoscelides obtectus TaxID=200917 RepID=A0A9P0NTN9_ACAOB|nr:unnamed protein product [Acanthoscelides obtectus]CAK1661451.1 Alpha-tocopherol transfer protein-like [Acanthoscelides obtectus]